MFICAPNSQGLAHSASFAPLLCGAPQKTWPCFASIGGLALRHGSSAVLVDSTIADCRASNSFGGGVLARDANVTLEGGSRIERCWSRMGGGALLAKDSNVALLNGSVIGESYSNSQGGGLHLGSGCTQSATPNAHTPLACSQPLQASPASLGPMGARRIAGWDMSCLPGGAAHSLGLVGSQVLHDKARAKIASVDDASCDRQLQRRLYCRRRLLSR